VCELNEKSYLLGGHLGKLVTCEKKRSCFFKSLHCHLMISLRSCIPRIPVQSRSMKVIPVPVRDDNYAYLLIDESTKKAAAVDPYDISKVSAAAYAHGVEIIAGITTHHHFDHSGGNKVCNLHMPSPYALILKQIRTLFAISPIS